MKTIAEGWESFRAAVIPDVSEIQRNEMRKAFYAGAAHLVVITLGLGDDDVTEEQGMAVLDSLLEESVTFGACGGEPSAPSARN